MNDKSKTLPLSGIRVTDFSWVAAGPWCTRYLATMGAEVIKIESSKRIDFTRKTGPFAEGMKGVNQSAYFNMWNQSKKSCTINLTSPKGKEIVKRLVAKSDIVVENFGYGTLENLGLDYDNLKKIKPDIIMVSSSGFGKTGPQKKFLTYGRNLQAASGLSYLTGYPGGAMGVTVIWSDVLTGNTSAFAVMLALHHRRRTGRGQYIDVSMFESTAIQLPEFMMDYAMNQRNASRTGNRSLALAPQNAYRCKGDDRWVAIEVASEKWVDFCRALGEPAWSHDARFQTLFGRLENAAELDSNIEMWTRERTPDEVVTALQKFGIAAGPSSDLHDIVNDKSLYDRGTLVTVNHPEMGEKTGPGLPWTMSGTEPYHTAAPIIGQDNDYVFRDLLGMKDAEIEALTAEGALS
ncbi:MAG: CoA transferase [Dehalococcoidales bacterium]|nr:CoA transferase [Dehalococcoidales bacterium]